jgi:hypothetical protein
VNTTTERRIAVVKDTLLFVVGVGGIIWQQLTGDVNIPLLGVFTVMAGIPGLTNLPTLIRGFSTNARLSSPASGESSTDSSQSSTGEKP